MYVCIYINTYVCMNACMYVCMYINTYIHELQSLSLCIRLVACRVVRDLAEGAAAEAVGANRVSL